MGRHLSSTVTARRPDPEAWAEALRLAGGDSRLLRASADGRTVEVLNSPDR